MLLFILMMLFIAVAVAMAWYLLVHDHGEKEPVGALWLAAGLGIAGGFAAAYIEKSLIPVQNLLPGASTGPLLRACLIVGIVEECCKFIPLAVFLYPKRYFNEHSDGVIYFALAGLGFGVPENILYSVQFGAKAGMSRLILTPLFHAATTALVGYVLIKRKLEKKSVFGVVPILLLAAVLHGLYDFGLTSGTMFWTVVSILITMVLSGGLFLLYVRATELDQDEGLAVVGHNSFCRSCGFPNPSHHLYCTQCGKNA